MVVLLHGGSQAGDPAILQKASPSAPSTTQKWPAQRSGVRASETAATYVALEGTLENQLLSHWEMRQSGRLSGEGKVERLELILSVTPLTLGELELRFRILGVGEKN